MALRIRRGSDPARQGVRFELGELVWTTDGQQLWVGDGSTTGGVPVVGSNIVGYGLTYNGTSKRIEVSGLSTDDVSEGTNRKYFSQELAQDAAALLFTTGVHTGVQFQYDDNLGRINATIDASAFIDLTGILSVNGDSSPELGGALSLNGFNITGSGNINITGDINATGDIDATGAITAASFVADTFVGNIKGNIVGPTVAGTNLKVFLTYDKEFAIESYNGTLAAPTTTNPGDIIGTISVKGYSTLASTYVQGSGLLTQWDATADLSASAPRANLLFALGDNSSGNVVATLDYAGKFSSSRVAVGDGNATNPSIVFSTDGGADTGFFHPGDGIVCISTNATERVRVDSGGLRVEGFMKVKNFGSDPLPSPAEAGMIVLQGGTFQGYNGSGWVTLG